MGIEDDHILKIFAELGGGEGADIAGFVEGCSDGRDEVEVVVVGVAEGFFVGSDLGSVEFDYARLDCQILFAVLDEEFHIGCDVLVSGLSWFTSFGRFIWDDLELIVVEGGGIEEEGDRDLALACFVVVVGVFIDVELLGDLYDGEVAGFAVGAEVVLDVLLCHNGDGYAQPEAAGRDGGLLLIGK